VVFGGFSAEALAERIKDAGSKVLIAADRSNRKGSAVDLLTNVQAAIDKAHGVLTDVLLLSQEGSAKAALRGARVWDWHTTVQAQADACAAESLDAEAPSFVLYTSGTTGKPKGVLHTTGGYLVQATRTARWVFDLTPQDVYWCTADIGWITGHSYVVYGVLSNAGTVFMYEGVLTHPEPDRAWKMIAAHRVSILYTAPTAIRAFIKVGDSWVKKHNLSSLRLLGSVGEPINPEAWRWYHRVVGGGRCPIVDTWWQTETGGIMISPLPFVSKQVPGSATQPLPGILAQVVDRSGVAVKKGEAGLLVVSHPWPGMLRGIYGDPDRFVKTYFSDVPGKKKSDRVYFTGDGAKVDRYGNFWVLGRVDDVVNVSGHRLGTAEVESALVSHAAVAEAAVVGRPDSLKGQALVAFVTLKTGVKPSDGLPEQLRAHVAEQIGPIAKPDEVRFTDALPKTRSGKIMRRLLRELATTGMVVGDVTTLEDLGSIEKLRDAD
jgi:acetyl-CoA synthetase